MPIPPKVNQIWIAYCHMPGGQIVVMHFEDLTRKRKVGDTVQDVHFTSREQMEGFKKSPQVALNIKGKITKNEVLVYQGVDLSRDKNAAARVIEWARAQGLEPIVSKAEKDASLGEQTKRINELDGRMTNIEQNVGKILSMVETISSKK